MNRLSTPCLSRPSRLKRKVNLSSEVLLSSLAAFVILVLVAAGICAVLARRIPV